MPDSSLLVSRKNPALSPQKQLLEAPYNLFRATFIIIKVSSWTIKRDIFQNHSMGGRPFEFFPRLNKSFFDILRKKYFGQLESAIWKPR